MRARARDMTLLNKIIMYEIAVISIRSTYLVRHSVFNTRAGQGLASRPAHIRSLYVYLCELAYSFKIRYITLEWRDNMHARVRAHMLHGMLMQFTDKL